MPDLSLLIAIRVAASSFSNSSWRFLAISYSLLKVSSIRPNSSTMDLRISRIWLRRFTTAVWFFPYRIDQSASRFTKSRYWFRNLRYDRIAHGLGYGLIRC